MIELKQKKCVPCEGGTPPLSEGEASELMLQLHDEWKLDEQMIWREFRFSNFVQSLSFVNRVGELAESEGHHPDIIIRYNKVKLELTTHNIDGLSENDFILASKIDDIT